MSGELAMNHIGPMPIGAMESKVIGLEEDGTLLFEGVTIDTGKIWNTGETPEDYGWRFLFPHEAELIIAALYPWGDA